jgi:hypothetical protein
MSYQFKITLKGIDPPIWRRIQIPKTFNMFEFASAIIDAMKYTFGLDIFRFIVEKSLFIPEVDFVHTSIKEIKSHYIQDYIDSELVFEYCLDDEPGVGWMHKIEFEGEMPELVLEEPRCLEGERAAPPEDIEFCENSSNFLDAYEEIISVLMDKTHPDRDWYLDKVNLKEFDDTFDASKVTFVKIVEKPDWAYDFSV